MCDASAARYTRSGLVAVAGPNRRVALKMILGEVQRHVCAYCCGPLTYGGSKAEPTQATLDHVVPRSRAGEVEGPNIVVACRRCNEEKAATLASDFYEVRKALRRVNWAGRENWRATRKTIRGARRLPDKPHRPAGGWTKRRRQACRKELRA